MGRHLYRHAHRPLLTIGLVLSLLAPSAVLVQATAHSMSGRTATIPPPVAGQLNHQHHHHQLELGLLPPAPEGLHALANIALPIDLGQLGGHRSSLAGPQLNAAAQQLGKAAAVPACALPTSAQTIKLRLLLISADGNEADLPAIKQALDFLGTPYDVYIASATPGGLTQSRLANGTQANYQGVILATGSLGYQSPSGWASALSAQEWNNLWSYSSTFCTRMPSWYTYPTPDYGFNWPTGATGNPVAATYTAGPTGRQGIFGSYANTTAPLTVQNAYVYQAKPLADGNSTSLLNDASGNALAVLHTYATGRQSLALSFDSNASLVHTLALSYGLVNWVTQGTFLGERHIYLGGQVDDMYINDDHWLPSTACGTPIDQTGTEYRITGPDFQGRAELAERQAGASGDGRVAPEHRI